MTIQEFDNTVLSTAHRNIPDVFNEAKHMGNIANYLLQWNSVEVNKPISTTEKISSLRHENPNLGESGH